MGEFDGEGVGVEDRLDDLRGLNGRLGDQQAHGGELARVARPHAAVAPGRSRSSSATASMRICWLVPRRSAMYTMASSGAEWNTDMTTSSRPSRSATPTIRSTRASRPLPARRHVAQHADDPCGQQRGQQRTGVGPAPVDGRPADPRPAGDLGERHPVHPVGQHTARRRVENAVAEIGDDNSLLIDSMCNTVTHAP